MEFPHTKRGAARGGARAAEVKQASVATVADSTPAIVPTPASRIKWLIVRAALWGVVSVPVAEWLIRVGGLRDE
jgi:hypothetical protein